MENISPLISNSVHIWTCYRLKWRKLSYRHFSAADKKHKNRSCREHKNVTTVWFLSFILCVWNARLHDLLINPLGDFPCSSTFPVSAQRLRDKTNETHSFSQRVAACSGERMWKIIWLTDFNNFSIVYTHRERSTHHSQLGVHTLICIWVMDASNICPFSDKCSALMGKIFLQTRVSPSQKQTLTV